MLKNPTALQVLFVTVMCLFVIVCVVGFGLMLFSSGYAYTFPPIPESLLI